MKAVNDKILILPEDKELKDLVIGKVLSVGSLVKEIEKGDKVLYNKFALMKYGKYHIVNENQIILKE